MEEDLWQDPLLLTDVSWQEKYSVNKDISSQVQSSKTATMADPNTINDEYLQEHCSTPETDERPLNSGIDYVSLQQESSVNFKMENSSDWLPCDPIDGRSLLGFSLTSPDLVICAGSPDIPCSGFEETPKFLKNANPINEIPSFEISLDKGITGIEIEGTAKTMPALFPELQTTKQIELTEASLELMVKPAADSEIRETSPPVISINAGGKDRAVNCGGVVFLEDSFFNGGDAMRTDKSFGHDEEGLALYQTARFGNFSYKFQTLEAGNYAVDLHFAEIIFTNGPPGMRVFNVFIQEEKVVSGIDIYAQVGSNKPLVLSDLKASVNGKEGLSIRFEGLIGSPIVCGISVRKDSLASKPVGEVSMFIFYLLQDEQSGSNLVVEGEVSKLRRDLEEQYKELTETKIVLQGLKRDYELKSKECQEAWMSLRDLQNELMRKSMHVGSLAFAIEGQVKEKSRWFSSLRDLTKKFKILKIEHSKLSEEALQYKKCLADMVQMTTTVQSAMHQHVDLEKENRDLKMKFINGAKERKELYNKVLELKGNIRVFCRCRPLNAEEVAGGASMSIDFESAKDGELTVLSNGAPKKVFKFDSVFSPQADQADVFEDTAPFATSVLDGYNVCVFAYGQTGTGKTFTMEGTEEARGVNYRTLEELFRIMRDRQGQYRYEISVSVLEVYNEQIRDLLVPGSLPGVGAKRLEIRQVAEGIHHVPGLVEAHVSDMNEVWDVLQTGSNARAVGATNANEHSSRSHCIHCVMVKGENLINGECTRSKLWLVDLAGSERVAKTDVQGERLKEAQNINRSLSALGDVISALATKSPHIPFRNSKLTHLLQDSLGGDSKALMFVQVSPNENDLSETLCSLNFASRVRGIELGPAKKQLDSSELAKYKQMVERAKQEMKSKDGYIKKMEETIYNLDHKTKAKDLNNKNLQDKVKELESQLLIERKLARQHVDTKIGEQQQQQQQQKQQQEEQNYTITKPPLPTQQPFGFHKNVNAPLGKDLVNLIHPLIENNNNFRPPTPPQIDNFLKFNNPTEKENKPEMAENRQLPKRTGRVSICTTARRIPLVTAPRRNSLAPLPTSSSLAQPPPLLPVLPPPLADLKKEGTESNEGENPEQTNWSLKGQRSGTKKFNSILRRSLQKKVCIKSSPMQQHMRRGGLYGGMEKVRLSIVGRGRMAQRLLLNNAATNRGQKEVQQKQNHNQKEKEKKGWNL
ncbi:Kinesin [Macleaya cordata]|uniref:Kinesin n=1 Tax=Macleaya cordata TaxID=56857 RepID=A0A200Q583_MACCD|nr:Kinesin [Macleaya cordata]